MTPEDTSETSAHVRLQVELVLEVADAQELNRAALDHIERDDLMPDEERGLATTAISEDAAEAIAYLTDPFDLVEGVPGVELAQASWTCETIDYDPEAEGWAHADVDEMD